MCFRPLFHDKSECVLCAFNHFSKLGAGLWHLHHLSIEDYHGSQSSSGLNLNERYTQVMKFSISCIILLWFLNSISSVCVGFFDNRWVLLGVSIHDVCCSDLTLGVKLFQSFMSWLFHRRPNMIRQWKI